MNKFNLTFNGEILPDRKPEQVKRRFGKMFDIDDPDRLERFFSGQTIILRRNLDRKTAADYFQKLRKLGVVAELVKVTTQDAAATISKAPPSPPAKTKAAEEQARLEAQRAEEAAEKTVLKEEARRNAAEEAARQQALREEEERRAAEEAARLKAEEQRKKAEEQARLKAQRAEEAARKKARREEEERKAAEEAARLKAEEQRKKAEEQARLKAQRAAEAARKKALKEEARRKVAEEAARRKAELAEKKRREAEEAARQQAQREEEERKAAEEAARREAELAERKRIEAQEAARLKAELAEQKRKAVEQAARELAILEEAKRKAAAELAKLKAEQEELARTAAEETARLQAEQRRIATLKAAEETAARQASQEKAKREATAQAASEKAAKARQRRQRTRKAARNKAEEQRKKEQHQTRLRAAQEEQTNQRKAMEEQAVQRAAAELAQQPSLKPIKARVKSNLELPLRANTQAGKLSAAAPRRRQAGEPNLYSLRPFRNTPEVRARGDQSQGRMRTGFIAAALALVGLLILGERFMNLPAAPVITGASAVAIHPQAGPALLAGNSLLLHDRSGVGTGTLLWESLGLAALQAPMAFDTAGDLLAMGRLKTAGAEVTDLESLQLLRCNLTEASCRPFSAELAHNRIAGFAIHTLDGTVLLADAVNGQLLKASADGTLLSRAEAAIPDSPNLRLESGLLFMNSAQGPAISVFRYDDNAFGQQLDEILLLPPAAIEAEQSRVGDFLWSADSWWASMYNPQTNSVGLYRFDTQWNFTEQADLAAGTWPQQLASWGEKILVRDVHHIPLQRFNAQGAPEVPLVSDLLETLVARQQRSSTLAETAWRASLVICALIAVIGLFLGNLQRLRGLVYKPHRERGADPVDEHVNTVQWVDPVADRSTRLRWTTIGYVVVALALLLLAIGQSTAPTQLTALLIALSGPAIALMLLSRMPIGHIGILQEQLLLVDHSGMYHLGGGSRVQYRGPFLLLDDVVLFTGTRWLPAFSPKQVQDVVTPLAAGGIKVDSNTVMVKLLQCRHPLAQGVAVILVSLATAAALLGLEGLF